MALNVECAVFGGNEGINEDDRAVRPGAFKCSGSWENRASPEAAADGFPEEATVEPGGQWGGGISGKAAEPWKDLVCSGSLTQSRISGIWSVRWGELEGNFFLLSR